MERLKYIPICREIFIKHKTMQNHFWEAIRDKCGGLLYCLRLELHETPYEKLYKWCKFY